MTLRVGKDRNEGLEGRREWRAWRREEEEDGHEDGHGRKATRLATSNCHVTFQWKAQDITRLALPLASRSAWVSCPFMCRARGSKGGIYPPPANTVLDRSDESMTSYLMYFVWKTRA